MLILSRNLNESLTIGDDITIRVVSIDRGQVKLAIDAPRSVAVVRDDAKIKTKPALEKQK